MMVRVITIGGDRFKVRDDVVDAYRKVSSIIGVSDDYLLAIVLALYRVRHRERYLKKVVQALLNEATRTVILSVVRFYKVYRKVDGNAKIKASRLLRCILDEL